MYSQCLAFSRILVIFEGIKVDEKEIQIHFKGFFGLSLPTPLKRIVGCFALGTGRDQFDLLCQGMLRSVVVKPANMAVDVGMWNVLVMGFSFMFIFTAFQTTSMIEVRVFISFLDNLVVITSTVFFNSPNDG